MTGSRLQYLVLVLGACSAGFALAGAGDITKRDQGGGSVELTNLGEEDAPVVVAVPAQASPAPAAAVATGRPASERPVVVREKRRGDKDEEDLDAREQAAEATEPRTRQAMDAGQAEWPGREASFTASTGAMGGFGYGAPTYGGSTGSVGNGGGSSGYDGSAGSGSGSGSGSGTSNGGSAGSGNGNTAPPSATPGSVLDSPELLAARLAQYRQAMVTEQRGTNGLPANPAVQRRYLMINRAGYMGLGL